MDPDRVLQDTLNNSLNTRSVTKHIKQGGGGTGSVDQITYVSFHPPGTSSHSKTVVTQGGGSRATSVTTETIGTNSADFVRYTAATNTENLPGAERLSGLYGIWAERTPNPAKGDDVTFLNESLYGIFPFGNLDSEQRTKLKEIINQSNVYQYKTPEKIIENKRPVYVYELSINAYDLVSAIQEYQRITGLGDPSQLNPDDYRNSGNLGVKITVDILSRQLLKIEYPNGRTEIYSGHNLYRPVELPKDTIPVEELQRRLGGDA